MSNETLHTADEVVDALGGTKAVAELTRRKDSAVSNWRTAGKFPPNTYLLLKAALSDKNKGAPDALWSMAEAERIGS